MTDIGVVFEGIMREILSIARGLLTSMRHLRDDGKVSVDPSGTVLEHARHASGAAGVVGPN